ncbi:MAG: response regulator [Deltaproteobacteria bacterium]|nr:response regulator [Deltaproteobacteria bacterium]
MKILVVDDDYVVRKKLSTIMESVGKCESVETGEAAVEAFRRAWENWAPFDLIMLDISMPDMEGTEVLYTIRDMERKKNIPDDKKAKIIMVSGYSDKDTVITSIQAGCDDYIKKPFRRDVILQKIKNCRLGHHIEK